MLLVLLLTIPACPPSSPDFPLCAWFGTGGCVCCDWNEDGSIDADDLSDFLSDWLAAEPCADATLDGSVDEVDLWWFVTGYFGG